MTALWDSDLADWCNLQMYGIQDIESCIDSFNLFASLISSQQLVYAIGIRCKVINIGRVFVSCLTMDYIIQSILMVADSIFIPAVGPQCSLVWIVVFNNAMARHTLALKVCHCFRWSVAWWPYCQHPLFGLSLSFLFLLLYN